MENKKLIILFATAFSIFFSIGYYILFLTMIPNTNENRTLYMNQVGLYEKKESIKDMEERLNKAGLHAYTMKQKNLVAVVCSVSTDRKETQKEQEKLKQLKLSYIQKSVRIEDGKIVEMIDQREYAKALERIGE